MLESSHNIAGVPLVVSRFSAEKMLLETCDGPLVFHHIPKTAGTSLTLSLIGLFKEQMLNIRSELKLRNYGSDITGFKCVAGHFSPELLGEKFPVRNQFTILRDPIARNISQYKDWSSPDKIEQDAETWSLGEEHQEAFRVARESSLRDFLCSDNEIIALNTRNILTRALCGVDDVDPFTTDRGLVDAALHNLDKMFWFGMSEDYQRSVETLWFQLGASLSAELLTGVHNASTKKVAPLPREELAEIKAINALDVEFYRSARALYERRRAVFEREAVHRAIHAESLGRRIYGRHRQDLPVDGPEFGIGFGYRECSARDESFRWTEGPGPSVVLVPRPETDAPIRRVAVEIAILAAVSAQAQDSLQCFFANRAALTRTELHRGGGIVIEYVFDISGAALGDFVELTLFQDFKPVINNKGEPRAPGVAIRGIQIEYLVESSSPT